MTSQRHSLCLATKSVKPFRQIGVIWIGFWICLAYAILLTLFLAEDHRNISDRVGMAAQSGILATRDEHAM